MLLSCQSFIRHTILTINPQSGMMDQWNAILHLLANASSAVMIKRKKLSYLACMMKINILSTGKYNSVQLGTTLQ